jgi:hypothetical protein
MREIPALSVAVIAGYSCRSAGCTHKLPRPSPLRARTALPSPGRSARARAVATAACSPEFSGCGRDRPGRRAVPASTSYEPAHRSKPRERRSGLGQYSQ